MSIDYTGMAEVLIATFDRELENRGFSIGGGEEDVNEVAAMLEEYFNDDFLEDFMVTDFGRGMIWGIIETERRIETEKFDTDEDDYYYE